METLKYILTVVTHIVILPLVLITMILFDTALSLWKIVLCYISEDGDKIQGGFNRFMDRLNDLFSHFKF